jgi:TonB family protein
VVRPKIVHTVPALMTAQAITAGGPAQSGNFHVVVNVVVDPKGNPTALCLQTSSGYGLDAAAATAVAQYHFDAAKKDGRPVEMRIPVQVRFVTQSPPQRMQPLPTK